MADEVDVLTEEVQPAENFTRDLGSHHMMLVEGPFSVYVFCRIEFAHIVEHHGHGAQPVVMEAPFRIILHALESMAEDIFRFAGFFVAHLPYT